METHQEVIQATLSYIWVQVSAVVHWSILNHGADYTNAERKIQI